MVLLKNAKTQKFSPANFSPEVYGILTISILHNCFVNSSICAMWFLFQ